MYSQLFCKIYNEFGWNYYPEAFSEQLLAYLSSQNRKINSCLDLGCGTGVLCGCLHQAGIEETTGVDFSEGMIRMARENYPGLHFEQGDMTTYRPNRHYDLVTCTGDALNHIFSLQDVDLILQNVYASLSPGGLFIFDILNEKEGQEVDAIPFTYNEHISAEFSITRSDEQVIELRTRVFEDGNFQFDEVIREKVHDVEKIKELLLKNGFVLRQCADRLLLAKDNHSSTWYIVAEKPV